MSHKEIMLVVGEASGDMHAADVARALLQRDPHLKIFGVGGEQLQQIPFETLFSLSKLTGMGLLELVGNIGNLWQAYRRLTRALVNRRPNLLILVDFPEFNLRLAKLAKKLGVPVLYYISPQIWAWRRGRIRQIARTVDQMAVVFPFEKELYNKHRVAVHYVGHPLLDTVRVTNEPQEMVHELGLVSGKPIVAMLPGSREKELAYHLPIMIEAAAQLQRTCNAQFFCIRASTVDLGKLQTILNRASVPVAIVDSNRYDAINAADLAWVASGTATLETALLAKPMIIVYRVSAFTFFLARLLVSVKHIGIVNIIAGSRIVPELVQTEFTASRLVCESQNIITDGETRQQMVDNLLNLRSKLGARGAADRVAELALAAIA